MAGTMSEPQEMVKRLHLHRSETMLRAMTAPDATGVPCSTGDGRRARFQLDGAPRCFSHALRHQPMLKRSLLTAAVVGTIITSINQGNVILGGDFASDLYWKIPLTYCVPLFVTTWGALINTRLRA